MSRDEFLKHEILRLNVHLPKKKVSLEEALSSPEPHVQTPGGIHSFKREELEFLSNLVPKEDWGKLQLPILISFEAKLGLGTARILGSTETKAICEVLGKPPTEELIIYRPEVAALRGKLPTTTQYLFVS